MRQEGAVAGMGVLLVDEAQDAGPPTVIQRREFQRSSGTCAP
jgi:hypothetical protein